MGQLFKALLILQDLVMETWMKHTWLATCQADIHLLIDIPDFPLNHQGDKELVRVFLQYGICQPKLESLHQCCMHLHALQLSDLCTGMGDKLYITNWEKYQPLYSDYTWPLTPKPSTTNWIIWNSTLSEVFQVGRYQKIPVSLGPYIQNNGLGWYYNQLALPCGSLTATHGLGMAKSPQKISL